MADVSSSPKRSNSPLSLRRSHSDGLVYGDRFIPARNAPQMEIAYSLMDEGDVATANASSPFRGRPGMPSSLPASGSFSASPSVSVAASPSGLFSSSSSAALFPDLGSTSAAASFSPAASAAGTLPADVDASTQSPPSTCFFSFSCPTSSVLMPFEPQQQAGPATRAVKARPFSTCS